MTHTELEIEHLFRPTFRPTLNCRSMTKFVSVLHNRITVIKKSSTFHTFPTVYRLKEREAGWSPIFASGSRGPAARRCVVFARHSRVLISAR